MGEGSLGHFSEPLYRRDFGQIEILGENWHFRWGWFFFMWDLKIHRIEDESQAKKVIPIVISTTSHFWCTNKFLVECIFILISMVYTPPNHHFLFFFGGGVKFFFSCLAARGWEDFKFLGDLLNWEDLIFFSGEGGLGHLRQNYLLHLCKLTFHTFTWEFFL